MWLVTWTLLCLALSDSSVAEPPAAHPIEVEDLYGSWHLDVDESLERLLGRPQGQHLSREEGREWILRHQTARLIVDERSIGVRMNGEGRIYAYKNVEIESYRVIFRIEAGGRQGRMELIRKGAAGDTWVLTSSLGPFWNWSVWRQLPPED